MEDYKSGIGACAGALMLKWDIMDRHVHGSPTKVNDEIHINVFINFESILRNITWQRNLTSLVNLHKQKLVIELESAILNLVANYRMYFKKEKCYPKIYFYYTNLNFKKQQMSVYNEFYRSYYKNKYLQNPAFNGMGALLTETIVPEIKLILTYIPDCYFLESDTFDGSLIPLIVSDFTKNKSVIVSSDSFDTLYLFQEKFLLIYIKRRLKNLRVISEIGDAIDSIITHDNPYDLSIFNSELYYRLLLSIKGSKIRNIQSAKGFGYVKFLKLLKDGMDKNIVLKDYESIDSVLELFPGKYQEDIKNAFQCTNLETQFNLLSKTDKGEIEGQVIDKFDLDSLEILNQKRFFEYPINLQGLLE
jgi:hypothetical protein